jgi:hypothetical protein
MTHGIYNYTEDIKMMLLEWNKKNYRVLSSGEAQRQLCDYVDWVFKGECKTGCRALKDYCVGINGICKFSRIPSNGGIELPFSLKDALLYIE